MELGKELYLRAASNPRDGWDNWGWWSITCVTHCIWGFISLFSAGIGAGQTEEVNIKGTSRQKGPMKKLYLSFP